VTGTAEEADALMREHRRLCLAALAEAWSALAHHGLTRQADRMLVHIQALKTVDRARQRRWNLTKARRRHV